MYVSIVSNSIMNIKGYIVDDMYIGESLSDISGLCANVCYSDGYDKDTLKNKMKDIESNKSRFDRVIKTGHHSIADHASVSVYLGNISKMLAMLLNSLEYYSTSERSARYTDISKTVSGIEFNLYNKWKVIIESLIAEKHHEIDEKRRVKLAQENARYFISVFNKTTSMIYTTTYRQWSYIMQWCDKFTNEFGDVNTYFIRSLCDELSELSRNIRLLGIGIYDIEDIKDRSFEFLTNFNTGSTVDSPSFVNDLYKVKYKASLACLAQAQRHRTLQYFTTFDGKAKSFYIPPILPEDLVFEWLDDMNKVSDLVPQGTLVDIIEMGTVENFLLKCKERLCGRAQLEVAKSTEEILKVFKNSNLKNPKLKSKVNNAFRGDRPKAKCELLGKCNEPCEFKADFALCRDI